MDNNNPTQAPMTPNVPPAPQIPVPDAPATGSNNKVILWFVIGLVIIVLVVGGIYLFLSRQQAVVPQTKITTTQASPSPAAQNLESDLNSINVNPAGTNSDFAAVDQDLKQL